MSGNAPRFKGKIKREIAEEAFQKLGIHATIQQVDEHFRKYGLPHCERSMYHAARRQIKGHPDSYGDRKRFSRYKPGSISDLVTRIRLIAFEAGGYDQLEAIVKALK